VDKAGSGLAAEASPRLDSLSTLRPGNLDNVVTKAPMEKFFGKGGVPAEPTMSSCVTVSMPARSVAALSPGAVQETPRRR
jgi:hypothetical protein